MTSDASPSFIVFNEASYYCGLCQEVGECTYKKDHILQGHCFCGRIYCPRCLLDYDGEVECFTDIDIGVVKMLRPLLIEKTIAFGYELMDHESYYAKSEMLVNAQLVVFDNQNSQYEWVTDIDGYGKNSSIWEKEGVDLFQYTFDKMEDDDISDIFALCRCESCGFSCSTYTWMDS